MATDNRPLSPHLQVYRFQWTSVLSITHRATGIVLCVGTIYLVWWLAAAAGSASTHDGFQDFAGGFLGQLILFGWTVCLYYHLANGIRHLLWDTGRGLELDEAYKSGIAVLIATAALTILTWIIGWAVW